MTTRDVFEEVLVQDFTPLLVEADDREGSLSVVIGELYGVPVQATIEVVEPLEWWRIRWGTPARRGAAYMRMRWRWWAPRAVCSGCDRGVVLLWLPLNAGGWMCSRCHGLQLPPGLSHVRGELARDEERVRRWAETRGHPRQELAKLALRMPRRKQVPPESWFLDD